jgi:hypothetical protein
MTYGWGSTGQAIERSKQPTMGTVSVNLVEWLAMGNELTDEPIRVTFKRDTQEECLTCWGEDEHCLSCHGTGWIDTPGG